MGFIYIYLSLSLFQESLLSSFIALSIHTFGRGCMLHPKLFFYHPALLCHSILLGKDYSTLNHSFGKELFLYKYNLFQESLLSSLFSIIPSWGGWLISYIFSNYCIGFSNYLHGFSIYLHGSGFLIIILVFLILCMVFLIIIVVFLIIIRVFLIILLFF